jgi:hypothetical protein
MEKLERGDQEECRLYATKRKTAGKLRDGSWGRGITRPASSPVLGFFSNV